MINSYNFSVNLAIKYGLDEAVMLTNFIFWIDKNKANQNHYHDGYYWTYNSVKAFAEQYPFWTEKQIRRILNSLEKQGAILTGNYNKIAYDRTKWYTVTEEAISIYLNSNTDLPKRENGSEEKVKPIPDIKPNIKTDIYKEEVDKIIDKYNSIEGISKCMKLTSKRKSNINARLKDYGFNRVMDTLSKVDDSDFLKGCNDRKFKADIDWVFNPNNFVKILEGKYSNRNPKNWKTKERMTTNLKDMF